MRKIDFLFSKGIISKVIGDISDKDFSLAMVVQARSKPKHPFKAFIALSKILSERQFSVYVDDLYSQIFFERSEKQQAVLNEEYRKYFTDFGCKIYFSKEIFKDSSFLLFRFFELAKRMSVKELFGCLPIEKRKELKILSLDEIIHLLLEVCLLEEVKNHHDILLVGHSSQAIIATHRNVTKESLSAIVIPRFSTNEEIDNYLRVIQGL